MLPALMSRGTLIPLALASEETLWDVCFPYTLKVISYSQEKKRIKTPPQNFTQKGSRHAGLFYITLTTFCCLPNPGSDE